MWFQCVLQNNDITCFYPVIVWTYTLVALQRRAGCTYCYYPRRNISKICFDKLSYSAYELFIKTSKYRWDMAACIFQALSNCLSLRFRSNCSNVFYEKGVLKILVEFTGKHLCRVLLFNKVAGWKSETSSDRETPAHVFSCEF